MSNIIVRQALSTDSFPQIAACLYRTDPYIYPSAFGSDLHDAALAISALMSIPDNLFYYKNILVAVSENQVCGVLLLNEFGAYWDPVQCNQAVKNYIPNMEHFQTTAQEYFSVESACPPPHCVEVIACCVDPKFRQKGVAHALLSHLIQTHKEHTITLSVLVSNDTAIALYSKCGFKIAEKQKGFCLNKSDSPDIYRMIRA